MAGEEEGIVERASLRTDARIDAMFGRERAETGQLADTAVLYVGLPVRSSEAKDYCNAMARSYIQDVLKGKVGLADMVKGALSHALVTGMLIMENNDRRDSSKEASNGGK